MPTQIKSPQEGAVEANNEFPNIVSDPDQQIETLNAELMHSSQQVADAEMRLELGFDIVAKVIQAVQTAPTFEKLKILDVFVRKSIELSGLRPCE